MKGKTIFTRQAADEIRQILLDKAAADRSEQKKLRISLRRKFQFYITDFDTSYSGFFAENFDNLVKSGKITIVS